MPSTCNAGVAANASPGVQRNKIARNFKTTYQPQAGGLNHNHTAIATFLVYYLGTMQPSPPHFPADSGDSIQPMAQDWNAIVDENIADEKQVARILACYREGRFAELEPVLAALLERHPEAGIVWKFQAICLAYLGKDASPAFERAAGLLPNDADLLRRRAAYLLSRGAVEPALEAASRLCRLAPENGADLALASRAAREVGRLQEAIGYLRRAVELDPRQFTLHNDLGNLLRDTGLFEQAEQAYCEATMLNPAAAQVWCNLCILYKGLGRHNDAENACDKARALAPDLAEALVLAGGLAIEGGRFGEAEQWFGKAIELAPHSAEAWAGIARTRKMTHQDEDWASNAAALADRETSPAKEACLRFALGKYFDDTRQFDLAFPQFERANELNLQTWRRRGGAGYEEAAQARRIGHIVGHFGHAALSQPRFAHPSARPVLVLGMPRSGTSLAEQILASHPDVHGGGELPFWGKAIKRYGMEADNGKEPAAVLPTIATELLRQLHAMSPTAKRVVDKMPNNFLHIGLFHAAFPNARIIHMQRDPVDVCLSIYFNAFAASQRYAGKLQHLAHYYGQYERLMAHWRRVLPEGTMLEVPYEALVQDLETWSRRMVEFIGLPWDGRCLRFHENQRAVRTPSNWQVRQKISTASLQRWRNYEKFIGPLAGLLNTRA